MPISRATSPASPGADIAIAVDERHRRSGLEHQLREAVRAGRLATGTRLPSSRSFAKELGVGRNTVADAYAQLVAEGWFESRHGAGTWVADRPDVGPGSTSDEHAQRVPRFDLRPGVPDVGAFPRAAWVAAARRALAIAPDAALGYADPRGLLQLREALAGYLTRARQVTAHPSRIVVCAGFAHGLALLGDVLRQRGATTIAVEAYGHLLHRGIVESKGLKVVNLTVDDQGAVVDELAGTTAALLTPAHQFPIGVALERARRRQAIAWASDNGSLLIEDDYDGEFRYDRQAVGAMQSLAPDHVVYAGTAAKSLAPGLRLGWLVVPEPILDEVVETKRASGIAASAVDQLTLADLIDSGGFDKHVRRVRLHYRRRRDQLVSMLSGHASSIEVTGIAAGLHALVHLNDQPEAEVTASAADHGLGLSGLTDFTAPGHERGAALVVGYATPPDHAYTATLRRLDTVLSRQRAPMSASVAR
jgi:GntR family transcriptional regulator/MocR family aminotransferase